MNKEQYLLNSLSEELGEVQQCVGKCLRFGTHHRYEEYDETNFEALIREMNDVYATLKAMQIMCDLKIDLNAEMVEAKYLRILKMMKVSEGLGVFDGEF